MKTSLNQLELWNLSRQLSSELYTEYQNDTEFTTIKSTYNPFPFTTETEFSAVMDGVESESKQETITEIQQIIYQRLKDTTGFTVDEATNNTDVLNNWNECQSAAKALLTWSTTDTDTQSQYDQLTTQHDVLPSTKQSAEQLLRDLPNDQYRQKHDELTRQLYNSQQSTTNATSQTTPTETQSKEDATHRLIAEDLVKTFEDHSGKSYTEIVNQFSEVSSFPSRDVSMMKVVNTSGDTREQKIDTLSEWVLDWMNDPEYAEELSHSRQRRMGMNNAV